MLIVFLPLILLSWKEIFFVLHTHIPSILIYFYIVFGHEGDNFPLYNNSQHDSDICQLAKHFHMCISGASEQPCEQNPHLHPLEAEDRGEEAEETEQAFESLLWRKAVFSHAEAHSCAPKCTSVHSLNFFLIIHHWSSRASSPMFVKHNSEVELVNRKETCAEKHPHRFQGVVGTFGLKKLALFYACKQEFGNGKDSKKERKKKKKVLGPWHFWG